MLLTAFVVADHAVEPHVPVGGGVWNAIVNDPARSDLLLTLFVFNRTFFIGFFFLISAYFLDASLARHGAWGVVGNRLIRLGIPMVVIVVFVFGSIGYALYGEGLGYFEFLFQYIRNGNAEFGHLWFIAHLLVYVLLYVLLRALVPRLGALGADAEPPGHVAILIYVLAVGAVMAAVRQVWPIDTWVRFFGLFKGEPADMPFYASLFTIGLLAGRANWFDRIQTRIAVPWFIAATAVFATLAYLDTTQLAQPGTMTAKIAWAFLEPLVGVGVILGLIVFFRRFVSASGTVLRSIEGNIYGIYLIHLFVVIGLQVALAGVGMPALAKFALVLIGTLLISYPVIALLRRVPGVPVVI